MSLSQTLQAAVDVTEKHVLCSGIQTQDGYKFPYDRPAGADLSLLQGKTTIASWENGKEPELSSEVIRLDNNSVITRTCRDLLMKVSTFDDGVREHWLNFTTTGNSYNPETPGSQVNNTQFIQKNTTEPVLPTPGSQTANHVWIGVGAVGFAVIILYLCWSCKKKSLLWPCHAIKKLFSTEAKSSEPGETRGREMQDTQQNDIRLEVVVATDPSGSGENGGAQDNPRGSVHDASLDHKLGNGEFQPTANGHPNNPDVDRASHHGDMNSVRSRRDDPGGSSEDVREDFPGSDTRAEAEPLVNKGGQDQDHVRRCSATPGHDVESMTRVNNFGEY